MILAHTIVGVAAGNYFGHFWYVLIGSIFPDIDHIFVLLKNKIFSPKRIIDTLRFEKKYNLSFKTKYVHSVFGAIVFSLPIAVFDVEGAGYFFLSYLGHLAMDYPDYDEKQYLYPLKIKFQGFWPIFSRQEILLTLCLVVFLFINLNNYLRNPASRDELVFCT
ncbi:MAG: metal-dependent hydrolase [Parcubacteria group bacterium]|jgi:hypothetical protein